MEFTNHSSLVKEMVDDLSRLSARDSHCSNISSSVHSLLVNSASKSKWDSIIKPGGFLDKAAIKEIYELEAYKALASHRNGLMSALSFLYDSSDLGSKMNVPLQSLNEKLGDILMAVCMPLQNPKLKKPQFLAAFNLNEAYEYTSDYLSKMSNLILENPESIRSSSEALQPTLTALSSSLSFFNEANKHLGLDLKAGSEIQSAIGELNVTPEPEAEEAEEVAEDPQSTDDQPHKTTFVPSEMGDFMRNIRAGYTYRIKADAKETIDHLEEGVADGEVDESYVDYLAANIEQDCIEVVDAFIRSGRGDRAFERERQFEIKETGTVRDARIIGEKLGAKMVNMYFSLYYEYANYKSRYVTTYYRSLPGVYRAKKNNPLDLQFHPFIVDALHGKFPSPVATKLQEGKSVTRGARKSGANYYKIYPDTYNFIIESFIKTSTYPPWKSFLDRYSSPNSGLEHNGIGEFKSLMEETVSAAKNGDVNAKEFYDIFPIALNSDGTVDDVAIASGSSSMDSAAENYIEIAEEEFHKLRKSKGITDSVTPMTEYLFNTTKNFGNDQNVSRFVYSVNLLGKLLEKAEDFHGGSENFPDEGGGTDRDRLTLNPSESDGTSGVTRMSGLNLSCAAAAANATGEASVEYMKWAPPPIPSYAQKMENNMMNIVVINAPNQAFPNSLHCSSISGAGSILS
jgi:hypothetical protein